MSSTLLRFFASLIPLALLWSAIFLTYQRTGPADLWRLPTVLLLGLIFYLVLVLLRWKRIRITLGAAFFIGFLVIGFVNTGIVNLTGYDPSVGGFIFFLGIPYIHLSIEMLEQPKVTMTEGARFTVPAEAQNIVLAFKGGGRPPLHNVRFVFAGSTEITISKIEGKAGTPSIPFHPPATPLDVTAQILRNPIATSDSADFSITVSNNSSQDQALVLALLYQISSV